MTGSCWVGRLERVPHTWLYKLHDVCFATVPAHSKACPLPIPDNMLLLSVAAFARTRDPEQVIGADIVSEEVSSCRGIWMLRYRWGDAVPAAAYARLLAGWVVAGGLQG